MSSDSDTVADVAGTEESTAAGPQIVTPVVVNLGKVRRKDVKALNRGDGRLAGEVLEVLDEVATELGDDVTGSTLVPVVLVYERKRKKSRRRMMRFPF